MKKASVIGHFGGKNTFYDGQTIKTKIVTQELEKALGSENVRRIDTYGWKKNPFKLLINCFLAVEHSEHVIFMSDEGGIKIFPWLLRLYNVFGKCSLHYVVIGGWLVQFLEKHKFFTFCLKGFDNIFAETTGMTRGLEQLGFKNVTLMPNFKNLSPLTEDRLYVDAKEPYSFCTFSRVMREKGIEDAVRAIRAVNAQFGRTVCKLDIYGAVEPDETEWFRTLSSEFGEEIRYCGAVPYDQTTEVLKSYFALLFPTFYPKEGIPGTIIDAYAAGLPVIASRWNSFEDIIDHGITGIGYPYLKNEYLKKIISDLIRNPDQITIMKTNCLKKAEQFIPANVMKILLEKLV